MAKELICPECTTEYWGPFKNAKCGECGHIFRESEKIFQIRLVNYLEERKVK